MDQRRRGLLFGLLAQVEPEIVEEHHVGVQFLFRAAFAGGAHDVAAGDAGAMRLQDALQADALFVGADLARHADVIDGRHVDQEAAGQGNVRGDAGALLSQRLLGDLDDDLLAFAQQIADGGRGRLSPIAFGTGWPCAAAAAAAWRRRSGGCASWRCCSGRRSSIGPPRPPLRRMRREMRCM